MTDDRNNYLHDVKAVATALIRINNNMTRVLEDIQFIREQMDEVHKDVFHHLPVDEKHVDEDPSLGFPEFMAQRRQTK